MTDAFDRIGRMMSDSDEAWMDCPAYWLYEPYSIPERQQWVLDLAAADGMDIQGGDIARCCGQAPRAFQDGYHLCPTPDKGGPFGRVIVAPSQKGKSLAAMFDICMRATGEIPFALRYPTGHDTGIPRLVTKQNIIRFGRRSKDSGEILDHNPMAHQDDSWDCGNVIGVGVFPRDRIVPPGTTIRLASTKQAINQNWWLTFTGQAGGQLGYFFPHRFIDKTKGAMTQRGSNKQEHVVHMLRNVRIQMLTFESDVKAFESIKVPTYVDEEPKPTQEAVWGSLISHATDYSFTATPYYGITWTKPIIFPDVVTSDRKTFHSCAFDYPYATRQELEQERIRHEGKLYEIGPRIWGMPTGQRGEPYYDRDKINFWIRRWLPHYPYKLVRFEPTAEWGGIKTDREMYHHPGLLDTPVRMVETSTEDEQAVWRLYEDRQDGVGYVSASDQAEGADTPEEAGDRSTCTIARQQEQNPTQPIIACTLRSTLPVAAFTREVLYAARYFHNALLAPESGRGAANEGFKAEAYDWPYWFKDTMIRQSTRKATEYRGFCPTVDRRETLYSVLVKEWLDNFDAEEYPMCPDEWILKEAAGAVVSLTRGGIKKCDHPPGETIDSLTAYAIARFVMQKAYNKQIKYRGDREVRERKMTWMDWAANQDKAQNRGPVFLGEGVKSTR